MLRKYIFLFLGFFFWGTVVQSQDLTLSVEDLFLEQRFDGGFHLFIRKKDDIRSVLITESTRDPELQHHNYAYRAPEWNPINGNEIRLIDGRQIAPEERIYSLISSTVVVHPELGDVFHIFIPWILNYGYENTRHGEIYVSNGTYLNLRAFTLPFGDYRGPFQDNPFILWVNQVPIEVPPDFVDPEAERTFREIAQQGDGFFLYATSDTLLEKIEDILSNEEGNSVDVVVCLDTTGSMRDEMDAIKAGLVPMLRKVIQGFTDFRIGIVLYKDYHDEYLTRIHHFTQDFDVLQRTVDAVIARGGGDIPEAVHEALYDGATRFPWEAESRLMILIGDAPPHPRPRGRITRAMVDEAVAERDIKVSAILLPPS